MSAIPILQISYHHANKTDEIDELINKEAEKLLHFCKDLSSCRVVVEKPHHFATGEPMYRVRLDMTVPPSHEIAVSEETTAENPQATVYQIVRAAFHKARARLKEINERRIGQEKMHVHQEVIGIVDEIGAGFGFIRDVDDRRIRFDQNALVGSRFADLRAGMGVVFDTDTKDDGRVVATTVRVVDGRGHGSFRDETYPEIR